jgi:hypothetical protein
MTGGGGKKRENTHVIQLHKPDFSVSLSVCLKMWGEEGNCPGAIDDVGNITVLPHASGRVGNVSNFVFEIVKKIESTRSVVFTSGWCSGNLRAR